MATSTVSVPCSCCLPVPYETTVTDRITGSYSHSGSVYSTEYSTLIMDSSLTPRGSVVGSASNSGVDDYGDIGGVYFDNQTVTTRPDGTYACSGLSTIPSPVDVEVVKDGNRLRIDWHATNSPYCGLGLDGLVGIRGVTFKFYWEISHV